MSDVFFWFEGGKSRSGHRGRAFSLIEVVLALAVTVFAILAIVALLPVGLESARDSLQESAAINVLSEVIADRQATPMGELSKLYSLPALTNTLTSPATSFFGLTAGNQVTQLSQARYRIDYTILPPPDTLTPYQAWFKVSWPAPSANPAGSVETVVTFPQP